MRLARFNNAAAEGILEDLNPINNGMVPLDSEDLIENVIF